MAQRLSEARKLCFESKQNFDDFKRKYAPDLSRTTIYRLTSIGAGTLSIEEQRKTWREEKREKRAAAKESRTKMSETDEAAKRQVEDVIAKLPSSWETPEESSKARTVVYTKPEQPERPQDTRVATAAPTVEPEDAPADVSGGDVVALDGVEQKVGNGPLEEFKRACNKWLPMMTEDERKQARIHHMEWRPKLKRKAA